MHGSGSLVRWLFDNHLVDEITLLTTIQVYRPTGRPQYGTATPDPRT